LTSLIATFAIVYPQHDKNTTINNAKYDKTKNSHAKKQNLTIGEKKHNKDKEDNNTLKEKNRRRPGMQIKDHFRPLTAGLQAGCKMPLIFKCHCFNQRFRVCLASKVHDKIRRGRNNMICLPICLNVSN